MAEVSEIRTGPILNTFLIPLFVFVDSSVGSGDFSHLGRKISLFKLCRNPKHSQLFQR